MHIRSISNYFSNNKNGANSYDLLDKNFCNYEVPGHAIFIIGYKLEGTILRFKVKNSYGK